LIPGLLLTVFWDQLGRSCFPGHPIYSGDVAMWQKGYGFSVPDRSTGEGLIGNLCFLQAIRVPPYGSNDALWSLSYEFWYYLLFPCAWIVLGRGAASTWRSRALCGALIAAIYFVVSRKVLLYFPIWLLGTAVCLVPRIRWRWKNADLLMTLASLAMFAAALVFAHSGALNGAVSTPVLVMDYCTGCSFALFLYFLVQSTSPSSYGAYARIATFLAGLSYTLYVVHMPFLTFLRAALIPAEPWGPSALAVATGAVITAAAVAYAMLIWFCTEARTDVVRNALLSLGPSIGSAHRRKQEFIAEEQHAQPSALVEGEGR
jgi:peptidoglycan/LPS O-acetylase OafA/YrhL